MARVANSSRRAIAAMAVGIACTATLAPSAPLHAQQVLNMATYGADASKLDPHLSPLTIDNVLFGLVFNGLVRFPPGSLDPERIEPDLAERWESSADGRTWTFFLRKGVRFHGNFGEFTADDAAYSLKRAANPKTSAFSSDFAPIDAITVVDPHTLRVTLKERLPFALGMFTNQRGGLIVSRKADEETKGNYGLKLIGTGPFAVEEYRPKQYVSLNANAQYFRGRPKIDRVMYRYIPSDSARDLAFKSGEIDLYSGRVQQVWVDRMRTEPNLVIDIFEPAELRTIYVNTSMKPLDDVRVRRAIAHAVNRAEIVKFVGADVARPNVSVVPVGYLGYTAEVPTYAYDPARAKALLAEAGYPSGIAIRVIGSNRSFSEPMQVLQAQMAKAGIKVDLELVEHATYNALIRQNQSALVVYGAARFPDADTYLTQFFHSRSIIGTPTAVTNFSHCTMADAEIEGARSEGDLQKQKALWRAAQVKLVDQVCGIPLLEQMQVWGRRKTLVYGYELKASASIGPLVTEQTHFAK